MYLRGIIDNIIKGGLAARIVLTKLNIVTIFNLQVYDLSMCLSKKTRIIDNSSGWIPCVSLIN